MTRAVTEQDFRLPEFRDAKAEDYEFRSDGALVRKDRWMSGIQSIRFAVGVNAREFEIPAVVERVRFLAGIAECALQIVGDEIWAELRAQPINEGNV